MARVQLLMPEDDHSRFVHQARNEGMTLSAWLRLAARERLARQSQAAGFRSVADVDAFFAKCDARQRPGVEPDWEEHLAVIDRSRRRGWPDA